jgi:peptide deformylase
MSILPINQFGDNILRIKAKKITEVDNKTVELIKNMFETMKNAYGIGLAANQVGVEKAIFVVDLSEIEGYEDTKPMVFINPEIIEYSEEKKVYEEGCLSMPELRAPVERAKSIKIKYNNSKMEELTLEADELLARVIQHEYDHLKGILFTDRIGDEIKKHKKYLDKIKKRKIEVDYPITRKLI